MRKKERTVYTKKLSWYISGQYYKISKLPCFQRYGAHCNMTRQRAGPQKGGRSLGLYLHVSLQLLQQRGVLVQPHEGPTKAGGEGQDAWSTRPLALHELIQLFTGEDGHTHTHTHIHTKHTMSLVIIVMWTLIQTTAVSKINMKHLAIIKIPNVSCMKMCLM